MWIIVGIAASTLTMLSFIPQIIKVARSKSARDVSLITVLQLMFGVFLWIFYGLHLKDPIIIIANCITFISLVFLLALYFKYGTRQHE